MVANVLCRRYTNKGVILSMNKKVEWGKEIVQAGNEIAQLAQDVGIPGISLIGKFAETFYGRHLQKRFEDFCLTAEIDLEFIELVSDNEDYSNCLYAALETVRQTNSKIGVKALALIYKDHWNNTDFLIPAARSFAQISDSTLNAFIEFYESLDDDKDYLELKVITDGNQCFHSKYNDAVELIHRNFFVQSTYASMVANGPMRGMKWTHTDSYYDYCVLAKQFV